MLSEYLIQETVRTTLAELGMLPSSKSLISQRKAYKLYGAKNVKRWEQQKLVKPTKRTAALNAKIEYSVAELEKAKAGI